jgi:hypothetical protein
VYALAQLLLISLEYHHIGATQSALPVSKLFSSHGFLLYHIPFFLSPDNPGAVFNCRQK